VAALPRGRLTLIIVLAALVAIVAVVVAGGGIDLGSSGDDDSSERTSSGGGSKEPSSGDSSQETSSGGGSSPDDSSAGNPSDESSPDGGSERDEDASDERPRLPENPDDVRGNDAYALTRPANLRRALAVLERERQQVEGVYDGLRIAPGRIDTTIVHPDDRRTNIHVRADLKVSFKSTHDFPTQADFRANGLTGRMVDPTVPARLLRAIDRVRDGDAAHDLDYVVISRDIIDHGVNSSAYMRIRTPRPRMFSQEPGQGLRVIG
jgi:hypothetical protein